MVSTAESISLQSSNATTIRIRTRVQLLEVWSKVVPSTEPLLWETQGYPPHSFCLLESHISTLYCYMLDLVPCLDQYVSW